MAASSVVHDIRDQAAKTAIQTDGRVIRRHLPIILRPPGATNAPNGARVI
jgi:hypothetical protein